MLIILYEELQKIKFEYFCFSGRGDRTRTCDPRFRKPLLYPAELRPLKLVNTK